jgi:hypothetical protein
MDVERIKRIVRARCRAARRDPDEPADGVQPGNLAPAATPMDIGASPAWTLFLQKAETFATAHREVAAAR